MSSDLVLIGMLMGTGLVVALIAVAIVKRSQKGKLVEASARESLDRQAPELAGLSESDQKAVARTATLLLVGLALGFLFLLFAFLWTQTSVPDLVETSSPRAGAVMIGLPALVVVLPVFLLRRPLLRWLVKRRRR